jgi:hypothetical protein
VVAAQAMRLLQVLRVLPTAFRLSLLDDVLPPEDNIKEGSMQIQNIFINCTRSIVKRDIDS